MSSPPLRLKDARNCMLQDLEPVRNSTWLSDMSGFVWGSLPTHYFVAGLKAVATYYCQQQQGRAAVLGGAVVPADHQHISAIQLHPASEQGIFKHMVPQLISGLVTHYLLVPGEQLNRTAQTMGELKGVEPSTSADKEELGGAAAGTTTTTSSSNSSRTNSSSTNRSNSKTSSSSSSGDGRSCRTATYNIWSYGHGSTVCPGYGPSTTSSPSCATSPTVPASIAKAAARGAAANPSARFMTGAAGAVATEAATAAAETRGSSAADSRGRFSTASTPAGTLSPSSSAVSGDHHHHQQHYHQSSSRSSSQHAAGQAITVVSGPVGVPWLNLQLQSSGPAHMYDG